MRSDIEKQKIKIVCLLLKKRDKKQHTLNRNKLDKIFKNSVNVFCHWCKQEVFRSKRKRCVDNSATIDHIYEKNDIRRYLVTEDENTVCACHKCNNDRAIIEQKKRKYIFDRNEIIDILKLV